MLYINKKNSKLLKEIKKLERQNKQLNNQILWLAEQINKLSSDYSNVTYGGIPIYRKPYININEWIDASKKRIIKDKIVLELERLLEG